MAERLKIRGIYSTALTGLFLDAGHAVVEASAEIQERFGPNGIDLEYDILIRDRQDLQGVELIGGAEHICKVLCMLQQRLLDAILVAFETPEQPENLARAKLEFPGASKKALDRIRSSFVPTLARHHRLRIIDSRAVERAERRLREDPEQKKTLEETIYREAVLLPLQKAGLFGLEHVRPSGKVVRLKEGVILEADSNRIVFKRFFTKGRYDGIDLPIEAGDYGISEAQDGAWYVKHSYYSREGKLKGEYFNINTPVELYPYGARYLDLEVDVVRRAEARPFLVDQETLALQVKKGSVGTGLAKRAMQVAERLLRGL